ncbi:hypothetical protein GUJ93_ZPchr0006g42772 [Zizania palustris]|uniref:Uncharacterized protein n=1 Tax=Zizania palustris TaxID=103762 RepID=A0A8J5VM94_ZIZPA|nr:hypothetical protein GUJ93_ZPchr0006g42772 [Zizania palustris]
MIKWHINTQQGRRRGLGPHFNSINLVPPSSPPLFGSTAATPSLSLSPSLAASFLLVPLLVGSAAPPSLVRNSRGGPSAATPRRLRWPSGDLVSL